MVPLHAIVLSALEVALALNGAASARGLNALWFGGDDQLIRSDPVTVSQKASRLSIPLSPPEGARYVQLVGPEAVSRFLPISQIGRKPISLALPARLEIAGAGEGAASSLRVFLRLKSEAAPLLEIRTVKPEKGFASLTLWPATYDVAIDSGPEYEPQAFDVFRVGPGQLRGLKLDLRKGPLRTVSVRDKANQSPTPKAEIQANRETGSLLEIAFKLRSGATGPDGVLKLGAVPSAQKLVVTAPARRSGRIRWSGPDSSLGTSLTAPFQDVLFSWTAFDSLKPRRTASVALARCQSWSSGPANETTCLEWSEDPAHPVASLDARGSARVNRVPPGTWRGRLSVDGSGGPSSLIDVSGDSEAPDLIEVRLAGREFHVRGRTLLSGAPVRAEVVLNSPGADIRAGLPDLLGSATSDDDGLFDLTVFASDGTEAMLFATADGLKARAKRAVTVVLRDGLIDPEYLLLLSGSGLHVTIRDRQTREPIPECEVSVSLRDSASAGSIVITGTSDTGGEALFVGLSGDGAELRASCKGYVREEEALSEVPESGVRDILLKLEPAPEAIEVAVLDASGQPYFGARVLTQSSEVSGRQTGDYAASIVSLGTTGGDGRLAVPADEFSGQPLWVVGDRSSLAWTWLPRCSKQAPDCSVQVQLAPLSPPTTLVLESASGRPLDTSWSVILRNGVQLPRDVVTALARANGFASSADFFGGGANLVCYLPGYLDSGEYEIAYLTREKSSDQPKMLSVAVIRLPSSEPIRLRVMALP